MATYTKRKNTWRVQICVNGIRESATFDSKPQARAWASKRETELRDGAMGMLPDYTLQEAIERYVSDIAPKRKGYKWERDRLGKFMRDNPRLVNKLLKQVTTDDLSKWRDEREKMRTYLTHEHLKAMLMTCGNAEYCEAYDYVRFVALNGKLWCVTTDGCSAARWLVDDDWDMPCDVYFHQYDIERITSTPPQYNIELNVISDDNAEIQSSSLTVESESIETDTDALKLIDEVLKNRSDNKENAVFSFKQMRQLVSVVESLNEYAEDDSEYPHIIKSGKENVFVINDIDDYVYVAIAIEATVINEKAKQKAMQLSSE